PVGHYAVLLRFDDGHDSGLYTWTLLATLGEEQDTRWPAYLAALEAAGLSR
ncbi:MAG TPA: gamma-butyrobetaine hydroxylase-like domain-containing protein, partial [Arenimonas sp.]|nr:gamma-butyrobetaine hydroxylase-like domain-containing protein [Arenimonas sp.]